MDVAAAVVEMLTVQFLRLSSITVSRVTSGCVEGCPDHDELLVEEPARAHLDSGTR